MNSNYIKRREQTVWRAVFVLMGLFGSSGAFAQDGSPAAFPTLSRSCTYWAADPTVAEPRVVTIMSLQRVVTEPRRAYQGQVLLADPETLSPSGTITFNPGPRAIRSARDEIVIAMEADISRRGQIYRVPAGSLVTHTAEATGEVIDFVRGVLDEGLLANGSLEEAYDLESPLVCFELPGRSSLFDIVMAPRPSGTSLSALNVASPDLDERMAPSFSDLAADGDVRIAGAPTERSLADLAEILDSARGSVIDLTAIRADDASARPTTSTHSGPVVGSGLVCVAGTPVHLNGTPPTGSVVGLAGLREGMHPVTLYSYDPQLGLIDRIGVTGMLTSEPGTLDPLSSVGTLVPGAPVDSSSGILLLRPVGTASLVIDNEPAPERTLSEALPTIHTDAPVIHVFAPPGLMRISGLDQIDERLQDLSEGLAPQLIWYPIAGDGTLQQPLVADRFDALMIEAMLREREVDEPLYELDTVFTASLVEIQSALETSVLPVDSAVWILRGGQLPTITPQALAEFLTETPRSAPIQRLPGPVDRGAMRWLYILTSYFSQEFSEAYIAGPIATVRPTQAVLDMASSDRSIEGPLLEDGDSLLRQVQRNWEIRRANTGTSWAASIENDTEASDMDGMELAVTTAAYRDVGLVVPVDELASLGRDIENVLSDLQEGSLTPPSELWIDFLAVWLISSDDAAEVRTQFSSSTGRTNVENRIHRDPALMERFEEFVLEARDRFYEASASADGVSSCDALFVPMLSRLGLWAPN